MGAATEPAAGGAASGQRRPRALLVGPLAGFRGRRLLRRSFEVTESGPGEAARALDSRRPDVVVIDAALPAVSLGAVLERLGALPEAGRPAAVMITTPGRRLRLPAARQAAVDDFVSDALGERQVVERITAALRVRGWMAELSRKNEELQDLYRRLEVLADRMAEELRLASNVQRSLMPAPIQHARLEVAREFIPFREIGGDYYDFLPLGPHRLAFAIGDVMGKGVPAALLATNLKASIRAQVEAGDLEPNALVERVNRMFWEVVPNGLFATLFYAVIDLERSRVDYVNAGHHYPFLVRPDGSVRDLDGGGTVLGLVEDSRYQAASRRLEKGDVLVFYSDGVTDRTDERGELYGVERLKEAAVRSRRDPARIALYSLLGEVQGWSAGTPPEDDATLVVAKAR
jgi:serine phosphatase RsbU (regulator of sigma subunit)